MHPANTIRSHAYFPIIDCNKLELFQLSVAEVNDLEGTSINLFAFGLSIPACLQLQALATATNNTVIISMAHM